MNEYLFYALIGIAAIALIGASYWLIKVRPVYEGLKKAIRRKAVAVRELNTDLEEATVRFRLKKEIRQIEYLPPEMISRAKELTDIIANGIERLIKLTFPSVEDAEWFQKQEEMYEVEGREPGFLGLAQHLSDQAHHGLWRGLRAIIVFNRDRILANLFPHPRGNLTRLRALDEEWEKLVNYQRELLKLLQKLPGSAEFLDAKEKARLKKKAERERQEQAVASIEQAKHRLEEAISYIRMRHSQKSTRIGELPVTAGAANLTLPMLEHYWERQMGTVNDMIQRAVDPTEIVGYVTGIVLPNLEGLFEEKAKEVVMVEFTAGELKGRIRQLSEEAGRDLPVPEPLRKAFRTLESEIPLLWSQAKWGEFDKLLKEVAETFEDAAPYLKEARVWLEDIKSFWARIAGVSAKEARLKKDYGIDVATSAEWLRLVANFETEALNFWSEVRFDDLNAYCQAAENTLGQHQVKVSNRLAEADREAGVIPPVEETDGFRTKLAQIASAGQVSLSGQPSVRRHHLEEPSRVLTGKFVTYTTRRGLEVEIDESMLEQYKQMDERES